MTPKLYPIQQTIRLTKEQDKKLKKSSKKLSTKKEKVSEAEIIRMLIDAHL